MKKVLITGYSGFLGRHLLLKLKNINADIYLSNTKIANLNNYNNINIYNNIKFDYIFHLAAHTKAGDFCLYHKGEQWEINQIINTNILKYWRINQPQAKMIAMGTSCSYSSDLIMREENYLLGQPNEELYTYAMTKRMLLIGLKSHAVQYGLKYLYFIPSTLYGPNFELNDSHFIFDLIKKIYLGQYNSDNIELWGNGHQKRELIYVDDAIKIMLNLIDKENEIFNLGTGIEYSIKEYAQIICDYIKYDFNRIIFNENKYVGVLSKKLDTVKIKTFLPQFNFSDMKNNIYNTIDYYKNKVWE